MYQLWTHYSPFSNLVPTYQSSANFITQRFKWCNYNALLIAIVVSELNEMQLFLPTTLEIQNASLQHILKSLNRPLRLTIHLQMISCAILQLRSHGTLKTFLERGGELGISI